MTSWSVFWSCSCPIKQTAVLVQTLSGPSLTPSSLTSNLPKSDHLLTTHRSPSTVNRSVPVDSHAASQPIEPAALFRRCADRRRGSGEAPHKSGNEAGWIAVLISRTSICDKCSGSMKITTRLNHIGHCKTASGTNWSKRWTYRVL